MDDRLMSSRAELEVEATRRGLDLEALAAQFQHLLGRRFAAPMTMRAQRTPVA
jgi:hypothetical protein